MDVRIEPEPSEEERRAIVAALERIAREEPDSDRWRRGGYSDSSNRRSTSQGAKPWAR